MSGSVSTIGDQTNLGVDLTALFCSQRCPGDVILKLYDVARSMQEADDGLHWAHGTTHCNDMRTGKVRDEVFRQDYYRP